MRDHPGLDEGAVCAAQVDRQVGAQLCEAFEVRLVDDSVFPCAVRAALVWPGVRYIDDDGLVHVARIVAPIEGEVRQLMASAVGKMRVGPGEMSGEPLAVGIDQQL